MKKWEAKMVALNWAIQMLVNEPPRYTAKALPEPKERIEISTQYVRIIERLRTQYNKLQERRHD